MGKITIRKFSLVLGFILMTLSLIIFVAHQYFYIVSVQSYVKNSGGQLPNQYISSLISSLSYIIYGFGFGGIIILLGQLFDPSQKLSFTTIDSNSKSVAPNVDIKANTIDKDSDTDFQSSDNTEM